MGRPRAIVKGLPCGREAQVAFLAADGLTDTQIGERLGIAASTVSAYWRRTLEAHHAKTRTELVALLLRRRITRQKATIVEMQETIDSLEDEVRRLERLVRDFEPPVLALDGSEVGSPAGLVRSLSHTEEKSTRAA